MKRMVLLVAIVLCFTSVGLSNAAPVRPKKSIETSLSIRIERDARNAKLIIPRSQVVQLRAELEQLGDEDRNPTVAMNFGRTQTLVSGTLLSLAFVFGGMWFVRSSPKNAKAIVTMAVLFAFGSIATLVYGNAGPPPEARSITGKMFSQSVHMYKYGSGEIKLEVSDDEDNPVLIVPDVPMKGDE